ncbi:hypothetical protein JCM31598_06410 [Desulfonatronum parangueonense]
MTMIWEYLILGLLLAWAVFYIWKSFFKKKGCSCDSCPSATKMPGQSGIGNLRDDREKQ